MDVFTFQFTAQEVDIIGAGLNKLPREVSNDLFNKLLLSYQQQIAGKSQPDETPPNGETAKVSIDG